MNLTSQQQDAHSSGIHRHGSYRSGGELVGVEAVIEKDCASALLTREVDADILIMATEAPAVFVGYGAPQQRAIVTADPDALLAEYRAELTAGSMLPKVVAACDFAKATGMPAAIGALSDIDALLASTAAPASPRHYGPHIRCRPRLAAMPGS